MNATQIHQSDKQLDTICTVLCNLTNQYQIEPVQPRIKKQNVKIIKQKTAEIIRVLECCRYEPLLERI